MENQRGKILIDVRELEGWLGVFDSYNLVTKDFQRFRGKGIVKVAIVDRPLPKTRDWFLETVPATGASPSGYSKISRQHLTGCLVNREPQKNRNKPMRGWHRW
jgi:hypothetical protein